MNCAKFYNLNLINFFSIFILIFPAGCLSVGDWSASDWSDFSGAEDSRVPDSCGSKLEDETEAELRPKKRKDYNNQEIFRFSSESLDLKPRIDNFTQNNNINNNLSQELIKLKFNQIKDAIQHNPSHNKEWLKIELEHFKKYINTQEPETGDTLLHIAVSLKNIKILKYLLRNGADYKIVNNIGQTPTNIVNLFKSDKKSKENSKLLKYWYLVVLSKEDLKEYQKLDLVPEFSKLEKLKDKFSKQIKKLKNLKISVSFEDK